MLFMEKQEIPTVSKKEVEYCIYRAQEKNKYLDIDVNYKDRIENFQNYYVVTQSKNGNVVRVLRNRYGKSGMVV